MRPCITDFVFLPFLFRMQSLIQKENNTILNSKVGLRFSSVQLLIPANFKNTNSQCSDRCKKVEEDD